NKAVASTLGLAGGSFVGVTVMLSQAKVGGGVSADFDGDVLSASQITVQALGGNRAESHTVAAAVGTLSGAGTGSIAEVTQDADVVASVGATGSLYTSGALLVKATGDNDAVADTGAGAGGIAGITGSQLSATIAGGVTAELDGDVPKATSVKVEAIGDNAASATALAISIGLASGAGAD